MKTIAAMTTKQVESIVSQFPLNHVNVNRFPTIITAKLINGNKKIFSAAKCGKLWSVHAIEGLISKI